MTSEIQNNNINPDIKNYKLCERCKSSQALLQCQSCSPFQFFCSNCDTIVHSLPSKLSHQRIPLNNININSNLEMNNNTNSQTQIQSPSHQKIFSSNQILNNIPSSQNLNFIEQPKRDRTNEFKDVYTKDYVTELKNIHDKEKNELLFKISSLENTLERLKGSFNDHITKMQSTVDNSSRETNLKIKHAEEENNLKIKKILDEKNLEINVIKEENEKYKKLNEEIMNTLKEKENELKNYEENANNNIKNLNEEIEQLKNENLQIKKEYENNLNSIKNEYENKINQMIVSHENQINDINIKNKMEIDNLQNLNNNLKNDNICLCGKLEELEKKYNCMCVEFNQENEHLHKEIQYFQEQNSDLFSKLKTTENSLKNSQCENELALKSIQRQREEINRKGEEIIFLNNNINSLKNNNDLLMDEKNRLQKDYTQLYSHTENLNYEYNNKLKNLNYIEDKNLMLERENNDLRNKIGKFVRPFSFNSVNC